MRRAITVLLLFAMTANLYACGSGPKEVTDMAYTATFSGSEYSGSFSGTVLNKLPHGEGTFTYVDTLISLTYYGQWEAGIPTGEGLLESDNFVVEYNNNSYKGVFSGEAVAGVPNGNGSFTSNSIDGLLNYSGSWANGVFSGEGTLETDLYILHFPDGLERQGKYKGDALDGEASGTGTFSAKNDEGVSYTYTGEWRNGTPNGYGVAKYDDPTYVDRIGTFENGKFTPTPLEFFTSFETMDLGRYKITDNAYAYIAAHEDLFVGSSLDSNNLEIDNAFTYKSFAKNPAKYGDKLIKAQGLYVVQIIEEQRWGYDLTFCILEDSSNNVYRVFMLGCAEDVYKGSYVTITALPLDYATYKSVEGRDIWAMTCAAVSMA